MEAFLHLKGGNADYPQLFLAAASAVLYVIAHNQDLCAIANKQNKYAITYIDF